MTRTVRPGQRWDVQGPAAHDRYQDPLTTALRHESELGPGHVSASFVCSESLLPATSSGRIIAGDSSHRV